MTCYHPLKGYLLPGEGGFTFNRRQGYNDRPLSVPCGRCTGCRIERSLQWAIRCSHEASLYQDNCFVTLTYDNEHLPADRSLNVVHFQQFMKKLRYHYGGKTIRFYHCGEYGEKLKRPHYHALLFNLDFEDKRLHQVKNEQNYYTSKKLQSIWEWGFCLLGAATFQSAAYTARYIMKKQLGPQAASHYGALAPEYTTMSRAPGLGLKWIEKYWKDVYPNDFVIMNGRRYRPPVYYDRWLEKNKPGMYRELKFIRIRRMKEHPEDKTKERLAVREFIKESKINRLVRDLE